MTVTIRGKNYRNMQHAATDLGVSRQTVALAKKRGTLDRVGTGRHRPVIIGGRIFRSQTEAARHLGVQKQHISSYLVVVRALTSSH